MAAQSYILISNAQLVGVSIPETQGWILVRGDKIESVGSGPKPRLPKDVKIQEIDATGLYAAPGFIDVHVHGGVNYEVMDCSAEGLRAMARFFASHGVTSFVPTTLTAGAESLAMALECIKKVMAERPSGATIVGAYLEGPYLNSSRAGAQNPDLIRRAKQEEIIPLLETGLVRLIALAPEYQENLWLIEECVRRGITVSAGHTAATYEDMMRAAELGLSEATHCFNAMTGLSHRQPGTVGAALSIDSIRCELIADNVHVHPAVQKIIYRCKGPQGVVLITDAVRGAGMPEGNYEFDHRPAVIKDRAVRLPDGTLAGSVLTMDLAVRNFAQATGQNLAQIWQAATLTPAKAAGVAKQKGSIEAGKDADIVLLDSKLEVKTTIVAGRVEYSAR